MFAYSLFVAVFVAIAVGTTYGLQVNDDCSKDDCGAGLTCQNDVCKKKMGESCSASSLCVTNAMCSTNRCTCSGSFTNINNITCAMLVHQSCTLTSDCVPDAECTEMVYNGAKRNQCQCKGNYKWAVSTLTCNAASGLAASVLMVAAIFVTSRLF